MFKKLFFIAYLQRGINQPGSEWLTIKFDNNQVKGSLVQFLFEKISCDYSQDDEAKKKERKGTKRNYRKQNSNITLCAIFIFKGSQNAYKLLFKPYTGTAEAQPHFGARRGAKCQLERMFLLWKGCGLHDLIGLFWLQFLQCCVGGIPLVWSCVRLGCGRWERRI